MAGAVSGAGLLLAATAGAADPVQLKSRMGNWCLDAPNGTNTATVVNACNGSKSQLWVFGPAGHLQSVAFGQCVTISNPADDTSVVLAPCQSDAANQHWDRQPTGQITSALGPCLNIAGGVAQPENPVIAYHCIADVDDEQWDTVS
ncbi:RICIN domain-containing protein [Mycobacterium sp.]|uniref:RICIN domain-containing protein n=1 Tax=Mycobacterium sp. TaxID=1785 RepID=UPI0012725197|nr:RICIN domain-containing protein [Mycobacterium sp.]KAA8964976.1 MAG: ricin-type beta-trefoil lectin domain protein [Mycobacterium sp.]